MAHRAMCVDCPLVEAPAPPLLDESFLQSGSAAFLSALLQSADRPRPLDKLVSFNICKRRKEVSAGPSGRNESRETAVGGRGSATGRSSGGEGGGSRQSGGSGGWQEGRARWAENKIETVQTERSDRQEGVSSRRNNHKITGCARWDGGHFNLGKNAPLSQMLPFQFFLFFLSPSSKFQRKHFSKWKFILSGLTKWLVSEGSRSDREASALFIKVLAPSAFLAGSSRLLKGSPTYKHIFFLLQTLMTNTCFWRVATGDATTAGRLTDFAESKLLFLGREFARQEENQATSYRQTGEEIRSKRVAAGQTVKPPPRWRH